MCRNRAKERMPRKDIPRVVIISDVIINTSGFATTHVVVSVRHPITY